MKNRMLSFLLAVLILIGMVPIMPGVNAASTLEEAMADVSVYAKNKELNWLTMNGSVKEQQYTYYNYQSVQTGETKEIPAYCVDPKLYGVPALVSEGTPIHYSAQNAVTDPKVCGIISNGYPHMTLQDLGLQSADEAYYATKTALWIYILGNWSLSGLGVNPNLSGADKAAAQRVLQATKDIYTRGMYWNELVSPKLTATADRPTAYAVTINGEECYQQVFTIDSNTWALTPIQLSLDEGAPAGAKIMSMDDTEISQIILSTERIAGAGYQGKVKVVYPKSAIEGDTGTCQLIMNASVVEYKIFYAKSLETDKYGNIQHYMLDTDPATPVSSTAISSYSVDPDNPPDDPPPTPETPSPSEEPESSTLKIIKLEEGTEKPLAGAIFRVQYPDGSVYGSFVTDASGTITLPINVFGNYTVTELVPPEYHILPKHTTQNVIVTAQTGGVLTFWNAPYGNLRVHKVSNTGDNLEGVSITIKNLETGETQTGKTAAGGVIEFTNLKPGGYEVKETAGIKGYVVDVEATKTATVVTGQTSEVTFVNTEKPGLKIIKFDRKTLKTMSDISFEIWRDGKSLGIYKTDAMGEIVMPDLTPGTYLIKEVQTDDGHIADPNPQEIELREGDGVRQVLFYNDVKPGMHLVKVDSENLSKTIPGVKFEIRAVDGSYGPSEFTTDANGEIDLSKLPAGAYVVTELECPGYVIDKASRVIQLLPNQTAEFVFTNTKKPSLDLVKYDPNTGRYLAGATFRIARMGDEAHYLDRVTDAQGHIKIDDLEPGMYSVQEIAAPSGYILNDTEYHVELFPGKTSEIVVENEKKPDLKIVKTNAITGQSIAGVTFTIKKADGSTLTTEATDSRGEILVPELDPGVYEIWEQSVPDGYLLSEEHQLITLEPNKVGVARFQNYPKPTLKIFKIDSVTGGPVEGARFHIWYASNNTFTGELNDIGEYYSDANGEILVEKLIDGWYRVQEMEAPKGYRIKGDGIQECYIAAGRDKVLTFENVPLSTIIIRKMDEETGKPLAGAWFRMKYLNDTTSVDGTTIGEWPTDENGRIEVSNLDEGTYVVDEISAPAGYVKNPANTRTVYLSGENQDFVTITYGNQKMGSLLIVKKDALTGAPLADVELFVTDSDGSVVGNGNGKFTTDFAGTILIPNLEPGKTIVAKETRTVPGYVLDDTPQTVKIKANETVTLEFRNQPKGNLIVQKINAATGEPLTGAEFKITMANGELTADNEGLTSSNGLYTVDRNGQVVLEKLNPGAYVVTETRAPGGFVLSAEPQTVVVNPGDTQTLTFANPPKGTLTIEKYDAVTNERLPGAQFKIVTSTGELVADNEGLTSTNGLYRTDENGQIVLSKLKPATYVVTEIEAPEGYQLDPTPQTVAIGTDDAQTLRFYDEPLATLTIIKRDATTKALLAGASFAVKDVAGNSVGDQSEYVTGSDGSVTLTGLTPNMTVVVSEENPPAGYWNGSDLQTTILKSGKLNTVTFENDRMGTLIIRKFVEGTKNEPLPGVAFRVVSGDGTEIGSDGGVYYTDAKGEIVLRDLQPGITVKAREIKTVDGYVLNGTPQDIVIKPGETQQLTFWNAKQGALTIRKLDSATQKPLEGVTFKVTTATGDFVPDANGHVSSNGLYKTDKAGEIILTGVVGTFVVTEVETIPGYTIHEESRSQTVVVNPDDTQVLTFYNDPTQTLTIKKYVSGTTDPIEGVRFKVTSSDGTVLGTNNGEFTTDRSGEIVLTGLVPGTTVTAREIETVPGYVLNGVPQSILIKSGDAQSLVFFNEKRGGLIVAKRDSVTGEPLYGAEFKITTIDGKYVDDNDGMTSTKGVYRTDFNGEIFLSHLEPNTYVVKEVKAPNGYVLDSGEQTVQVNANDTQLLTFTNTPKQSVVIQKYIDGTNKPLAGVTFLVTDGSGRPVGSANGEHITDRNGRIVLDGLTPGMTLIVRETKTVKGYTLNGEPQVIVVGVDAGAVVEPSVLNFTSLYGSNSAKQMDDDPFVTGSGNSLVFYDDPLSTLIIKKYVEGTKNEPISGVAFRITDGNGGAVGRNDGVHYTNSEGEIVITDLEPGAVITAREVKAANGFVLDGTPKQVTIKDSEVHELVFWNAKQGSLTIRKLDSATQKPLEGVTFKVTTATGDYVPDENGKVSSNGLYKTNKAGEIVLTGVVGTFVVTEVETVPGYTIHEESRSQTVVVNPDDTQVLTFYNDPTQTLTIKKFVAGTTDPIEGVRFKVTSSDGTVLGTNNGEFMTDRSGEIVLTGLVPGTTVTAKEISTVSGFVLNSTPQSILIKSGETQSLEFFNEKKGGLIVRKVDSVTGEPLKGAEFKITTISGELVADNEGRTSTNGIYVTDANGEIVLRNLLPDTYVVTETRAPANHVLDKTPQSVEVGANDTQTLTFRNDPLQSVTIQKFEEGTTKGLPGVTFLVTDAGGAPVGSSNGEHITDANGRIVLNGLVPGTTLIVREIKTVKGYQLNGHPQTIVVGTNSAVSTTGTAAVGAGGTSATGTAQGGNTVTFFDEPLSTLVVQKYIAGTTDPIKGVAFLITDQDGKPMGKANGEFLTDDKGRIVLENLEPGMTITAKEIRAAKGYVLDSQPKSITIKSGDVQELNFENTPEQVLTIHKYVTGTTDPIKGVAFLITDQDGKPMGKANGEFLTDENGNIVLTGLKPGDTITAKETRAADGYVLDSQPKTITVQKGEAQELNFYNAPTGSLTIIKRDRATEKPLKGATFQLTYADGEFVDANGGKTSSNGSYTTDENGQIIIRDLNPSTIIIRETKAPDGYLLNDAPVTVEIKKDDAQTITIYNDAKQALTIQKFVTGTSDPISGVKFLITDSSGATVGPNQGEYTTDRNGRIVLTGLEPGVTITAREISAAKGYVLDSTPQSILVKQGEAQSMTFYNTPDGGLEIIKVDASDKTIRIPNTTFEIRKMDQGLVTTATTDKTGRGHVKLDAGDYYLVETEAAEGYKLDATPIYFTVTDGKTTTVTVTNKAVSGILIHKTDAATGKGIYGVTFLLYDSKNNPLGQFTSDNQGYVRIEGIDAGRYTIRELENKGYVPDTVPKTVEVKSGETTLIEWKNIPITAQIQITKKSADYNPVNGLPAGTLLEGAVFEIYDKANNLVDTIKSDNRGLAASRALPLGRYTIREVKAPANYGVNETELTAYLEHEGEIVRFEVTNKALVTGVSINKTGPKEAMIGQPVRYQFSRIGNTSNVRLDSFYWRDQLPAEARLESITTGTYNFPGSYKITYRVNGGEPKTLADNLSTSQNYTLAASPVALGLASDQRVTEIMFVFGQAPAGFAQVEAPSVTCTVVNTNAKSFVNIADIGGVYNGQWVQGVTRWVTEIYRIPVKLPRTGY